MAPNLLFSHSERLSYHRIQNYALPQAANSNRLRQNKCKVDWVHTPVQRVSGTAATSHAAALVGTCAPEVSLLSLLISTALPVVKVAMLCSVGACCSIKGILTADGRRMLSGLVYNVFSPCLFLGKLANVNFTEVSGLGALTVNMIMSHVVGAIIAWGTNKIAPPPQDMERHMMTSTAAGNVGNLPLVLVESLATGPGLSILGASAHHGIHYVMLSGISATFIQFPLVSLMLQSPMPVSSTSSDTDAHKKRQKLIYPASNSIWLTMQQTLMTPPIVSAVVALAIGQLPVLKESIYSSQGSLGLIGEVVRMLGDMTIPSMMLVLGANLSKGPSGAKVPIRCIISSVLGRLVLLPCVGAALVVCLHKLGLLSNLTPTALVVMMMMHAVPTALLVHSIASMLNSKEDEVATILFWQYLCCLLTLPVFMSLFLYIAAWLI